MNHHHIALTKRSPLVKLAGTLINLASSTDANSDGAAAQRATSNTSFAIPVPLPLSSISNAVTPPTSQITIVMTMICGRANATCPSESSRCDRPHSGHVTVFPAVPNPCMVYRHAELDQWGRPSASLAKHAVG